MGTILLRFVSPKFSYLQHDGSVVVDFGQSIFGQSCPHLAKPHLANTAFGPKNSKSFSWPYLAKPHLARISVLSVLAMCCVCVSRFWVVFRIVCGVCVVLGVFNCVCCVCCVFFWWKMFGGCLQEFGAPPPDRPKFRSLFFSLSCRKFHSFFFLWGVFSLNFGGVFEGRDPQMCTFGLSGCRVKPRRLRGRQGFTQQPENSKRAHLTARRFQTPPKNHEKTHNDREKERNWWWETEKKSAKFWAPHPSGPHPSGPHSLGPDFFWVWAPPFVPWHTPDPKMDWPKMDWPNWSNQDGQNGIGQSRSLPMVHVFFESCALCG